MILTPRRFDVLVRRFALPAILSVVAGSWPAPSAVAGEPAGIYALLPSYNSASPIVLKRHPIWQNTAIAGVTVRTVWANVQPTNGPLNWSYFDEAIQLAAANGKMVGLSLAAGTYTPAWVYAAGAQPFDVTVQGPWQAARAGVMPEPWDATFQWAWGTVISELGSKYDTDPNVAYVMIGGLGWDIESFFVKTPADLARLDALGGPALWLRGSEQIIDLYAAAFPHKPFILAMAPPIGGPAGVNWMRQLVSWGMQKYPGRFGVMYDGLNAVASTTVYQNAAVSSYSAASPTGFQMVWSSGGTEGQQRLLGTLAQALSRAEALQAHWTEVYESDCENPLYRATLQSCNAALEQNAAAAP